VIGLDFITIVSVGALGLLIIGVTGMVVCNNSYRILLALAIAQAGVNLLLILIGYRPEARAPILGFGPENAPMVDPIPQVLVLTAIVIGVGVQALAISLLIKIRRRYGTLDFAELKRRFEQDLAAEQGLTSESSDSAPVDAQEPGIRS
jgi:multisubunit Na+/H+ antiporter MnhC subunit